MKMTNGYVIYEGPSEMDGSSIVVIATGFVNKSSNIKTGELIQTFIMKADKDPFEAAKLGEDFSVCGNCPHRKVNMNTCYVQIPRAPSGVWRAWKRDRYERSYDLPELGRDKAIRLGSYGDPTAIPYGIVESFVGNAIMKVGYTHQWKVCDQRFKSLCMASVDSMEEAEMASGMGWRYFRVTTNLETKIRSEVICPASVEKNHLLKCSGCGACNGANGRKGNIIIKVHGARKSGFKEPFADWNLFEELTAPKDRSSDISPEFSNLCDIHLINDPRNSKQEVLV
jgi:hypothetical protein